MTLVLAAVLALLLSLPAAAQQVPNPLSKDGSNASPEFWTRAAPHVNTLAELQASAVTDYPNGVWRDDYAAGRGAPPLFFAPNVAACTVADGGGCVNAPGGSWRARHPAAGIDVRQFGAATDGVTDSRAAIQAAIVYSQAIVPNGGPPVVLAGGIDYVLADTLAAYATVDLTLKWEADSTLRCTMTGADKACLSSVHPSDPTIRNTGKLILQDPRMEVGTLAAGSVGPILFFGRNVSGLKLTGYGDFKHNYFNTIFSMSSCWNCDLGPASMWGGGYNWRYKDASALTFSIANGSSTLTASAGHFAAADVGHAVTLRAIGNNRQMFIITGVTSTTTATVQYPSVHDFVGIKGFWDGAKGTMTAASTTLTLDAGKAVAADVGRVVYVIGAGTPIRPGEGLKSVLRAKIASVTSPTVVVLDKPAGVAVTGEQVIISPVVDLWSYDGVLDVEEPEDITGKGNTNDFRWDGLRIPPFVGVGLVAYGGALSRITNGKFHACNKPTCTEVSAALTSTYHLVVLDALDWFFSAMAYTGQTANPRGTIYVSGNLGDLNFGSASVWAGVARQPLVFADPGREHSSVVLNDLSITYPLVGKETLDTIAVRTTPGQGQVAINGSVRSRLYTLPQSETTNITANSTYTIPVWAKRIKIQAIGQGGGGGSGMSGDDTANRHGGVGGNAGSWAEMEIRLEELGVTALDIVVGSTGGAGGTAATGAVGVAGGAGQATSIATVGGLSLLLAHGGNEGDGGTIATQSPPNLNPSMYATNIGAISSVTGTPSAGGANAAGAPGAGGAGGGKASGGTLRAGSDGGIGYRAGGTNKDSSGGSGGAVAGAACTAGSSDLYQFTMGGGGGGGAAGSGVSLAGCAGGVPGGGGGGGGASAVGVASGIGGAGGRGEVRITAYR